MSRKVRKEKYAKRAKLFRSYILDFAAFAKALAVFA
jgi:hypothetical protein